MAITITFSTAGSFTIEDDGIPGNAQSIVRRDSDGAILAVVPHPADSLTIRATVPGVNLTFNVTDSFGSGVLTVGSLTNAAETPDSIVVRNILSSSSVTLVSNGSIVEGGSDFAADISASSIILSAGTGVGTPGNAIETQTGLLEAETTTGGIAISNVGDLVVGGFSANVDGLDVITSGDIRLTNLGSITLADETSFDSVHGGDSSGDVTLIANGYDSDITSIVDQSSIIAARGSVFLTAGRDVSFGLGGVEFGNDVRANGSIVVNAGRDFLLSGFADFFADGVLGTSGGNLIANAGRNISILDDTGNSGSLAVLGSGGGSVILTTGPGGGVTLETPSTNTIASSSGSVIINADRMIIGSSSGITAPGDVTLRPVSEGRAISLGSLSDGANALELSDGELDRIFANRLILGSDTTGPITVGAPIAPGSVTNFTLRSGADIFVNFSLTAPNTLSLFAGDSLFQLAAAALTATTLNAFVDVVGDDDGAGGVGLLLGTVTATNISLSGNDEADTLRGAEGVDQIVRGNGGNDRIISSGEGSYFGDGGDDTIVAGLSTGLVPEILNGGAGIDTLDTRSLNTDYVINLATGVTTFAFESFTGFENLISGNGNDTLTGSGANNIIDGGGGNDVMDGANGNDTASYATAASGVTVNLGLAGAQNTGGAGIDTLISIENLTGSIFGDTLIGNAGNNVLTGGGGGDTLVGLGGDDTLIGSANASSTLQGGTGNDTYRIASAGNTILEFAGEGNDRIYTSVSFTLPTGREIESIFAADQASTAALNLTGNAFAQVLVGNAGANVLIGGGGADYLIGGAGNDTLFGNADANSTLQGGTGDDTYFVSRTGDSLVEFVGEGNDRVLASVSYTLTPGKEIEILSTTSSGGTDALNLTGNEFAQTIIGNNGANILAGAGGADNLAGFGGADILAGGEGGDVLNGGAGNDILNGGAGADLFIFADALAANVDLVQDFVSGLDRLFLENAVFTGLPTGALAAGAFRVGNTALDADDRIIYNPANGALLFDADGDGAGAAIQFATLSGAPALAASDFVVI